VSPRSDSRSKEQWKIIVSAERENVIEATPARQKNSSR